VVRRPLRGLGVRDDLHGVAGLLPGQDQVYEVLLLTEEMDLEGERVRVAEQIAPCNPSESARHVRYRIEWRT